MIQWFILQWSSFFDTLNYSLLVLSKADTCNIFVILPLLLFDSPNLLVTSFICFFCCFFCDPELGCCSSSQSKIQDFLSWKLFFSGCGTESTQIWYLKKKVYQLLEYNDGKKIKLHPFLWNKKEIIEAWIQAVAHQIVNCFKQLNSSWNSSNYFKNVLIEVSTKLEHGLCDRSLA